LPFLNEALLQLSLLAFNLASAMRIEYEDAAGSCFDLARFQRDVLKAGGRVVKHARRLVLQAVPLILRHVPLDWRQFPNLMPPRLGVTAGQLRAATTALGGLQPVDFVALVRWQQGPLVLGVTRLPAALLLRLWFGRNGLGVRMLRARRQRGILRRLPQARDFRLQFRDLRQQQPNDGLA
jgi:hypothetical protein